MDVERRRQVEQFIASVGISAQDSEIALFDQALTHKSYAFEAETGLDNERLEFLGDAVVGLAASQMVYEEFTDYPEGRLSQAKAAVVSRQTLGKRASDLGFGAIVRFGRGEVRSGGPGRINTLGSTLEALVGALYLLHGYDAASDWIRQHVLTPSRPEMTRGAMEDFKSRLQEWTQSHLGCLPQYHKIHEAGPEHSKTFRVEVLVEGQPRGQGEGKRLKEAENAAAREALRALEA